MKKIVYVIAGAAIVFASSCKKYLDINENPNSPTASTADLVCHRHWQVQQLLPNA
jgi:hypothetical protein